MAHVMLDLETFGTKPGCVLRSVGAVVFDPSGGIGAQFYANIDRVSCEGHGLTVDPGTEKWWREQAQEAQDALLVDAKPLLPVVSDFHAWFRKVGGRYVWSQGANFDPAIWEAAAAAVGARVPWKFWDVRDTRTIYDIFGFDTKSLHRAGTYHNALDDAKHQVLCVQGAVAKGRPAIVTAEAMVA